MIARPSGPGEFASQESGKDSPALSVIYLGGHARSGSTVFEMLLGEIVENSFCAGELTHLPLHVSTGIPCSSGHPLGDCPIWGDVTRGFSKDHWLRLSRMRGEFENRVLPSRHTSEADRAYAAELTDVLFSISEATGASTIIDSSKTQLRGRRRFRLLELDGRLDLKFIHLERPLGPSLRSAYNSKGAPTAPNRRPVIRAGLTPITRYLSQREALRAARASNGWTIKFDLFREADLGQVRILADAIGTSESELLSAMSDEIVPRCSIGGNRVRQSGAGIRILEEST